MAPELEPITLKLQGDIADSHRIDAFQLADTINGFGQVTGHSLYLLQRLEVAGKKQRVTDLQVLAKPPEAGSVEIIYFIEALRHISPFLFEPFIRHGSELLWRTIGTTFLLNSGRRSEAMQMAEMCFDYMKSRDEREYLKSRDERDYLQRSEERAKDERRTPHLFEMHGQRCQSGCKNAVASVGKTSKTLMLPFNSLNVEFNENDAHNIRLSAEESVGPETHYRCVMDGIIEHNKTIKIQVDGLTDDDKYITAEVKDNLFGQTDNPYITALNTKLPLILKARPVLKDGRIIRLIVFEAILDQEF